LKVFIYGYLGNMAQRYRAVLAHLGHEAAGCDAFGDEGTFTLKEADAVIVATPTVSHAGILVMLKDCGLPILCEKPLATSMLVVEETLDKLKSAGTRLQMVSQYDYLVRPGSKGETVYDYFRHGGDGLFWDCINIVKHAEGPISLRESSPIWTCQINGHALSLADMDAAYVEMLDHWLRDSTRTDYAKIYEAHKKVYDLERAHCQRKS
jgi:hypothetical protein